MTQYNIYVEVNYTETYTVDAINELEARNIYLNKDQGNPTSISEKDKKVLFVEQAPEDNQPQQLELDFDHATK